MALPSKQTRNIKISDIVSLKRTRSDIRYYEITNIEHLNKSIKISISEIRSDDPDNSKYINIDINGKSIVKTLDDSSSENYIISYILKEQLPKLRPESKYLLENYKIIRKISGGNYGTIYEVEVKDDFSNDKFTFVKGQRLAMKEDIGGGIGEITEIDILNRVDHKYVVNAYDTIVSHDRDGDCIFIRIIMPLARYDFSNYLKRWDGHDPQNSSITMLYRILCGLNYLHINHIIHEDLKPNNILIYADRDGGEGRIPKITDFGISNILVTNTGVSSVSQTLWWRPPEILTAEIEDKQYYHMYETDMWAMGVIFIETILNYNPFSSNEYTKEYTLKLINNFLEDGKWKLSSKLTPELIDIISKLLDPNPLTRITSSEALDHPVFDKHTCDKIIIEPKELDMTSSISPIIRLKVTKWMKKVTLKFETPKSSIFLAIDIYDRYMAIASRDTKCSGLKKYYKLVAIASLYLSINIIDNNEYIPEDFMRVSDDMYSFQEFINMVCTIMKCLNWEIYRSTLNVLHPDTDIDSLEQCYIHNISPSTLADCSRFL